MRSSILPVRILQKTVDELFPSAASASEACRAAIFAVALTEGENAPLPSEQEKGASAWTTVTVDPVSFTMFSHLVKERGYRNLTVILAAATLGPKTSALAKQLLTLPINTRTDLFQQTLREYGLAAPEKKKNRAEGVESKRFEKKLRDAQLRVLTFISKQMAYLPEDTKKLLERDASALLDQIRALSSKKS